jgi:hypothetical protein
MGRMYILFMINSYLSFSLDGKDYIERSSRANAMSARARTLLARHAWCTFSVLVRSRNVWPVSLSCSGLPLLKIIFTRLPKESHLLLQNSRRFDIRVIPKNTFLLHQTIKILTPI